MPCHLLQCVVSVCAYGLSMAGRLVGWLKHCKLSVSVKCLGHAGKRMHVVAGLTEARLGCDLLISRREIADFESDGYRLSAR